MTFREGRRLSHFHTLFLLSSFGKDKRRLSLRTSFPALFAIFQIVSVLLNLALKSYPKSAMQDGSFGPLAPLVDLRRLRDHL